MAVVRADMFSVPMFHAAFSVMVPVTDPASLNTAVS